MSEQPRVRSAFAERTQLRKQEEARQLAQMIASSINISNVQSSTQPMVSLDEFNKVREELERTRAILQDLNKVKDEVERTKPIIYSYEQVLQDQMNATENFIKNRIRKNTTARILNDDMNFALMTYASEEYNVIITERQVRSLVERFGFVYKQSGHKYYYHGGELI